MTPNKQVSPVIRISREERDASARATHLEAVIRKFLVTTNERKYMSTKTNFKRIALVAVAALGLGVLSSVPSNAALDAITVSTATNGTATTTAADSTTAGTLNFTALANTSGDSVSVQLVAKPGTTANANLSLVETATTLSWVDTAGGTLSTTAARNARTYEIRTNFLRDTVSSQITQAPAVGRQFIIGADTNVASVGYIGANFRVQLDSTAAETITPGTYSYSVIFKFYVGGGNTSGAIDNTKTVTRDINIVVAVPTTASTTANATNSRLFLAPTASASADAAVLGSSTASATPVGYLTIKLRNSSDNNNASESVTVTTTVGQVGNSAGTIKGRSIVLAYSTDMSVGLYGDGTAGTATITVTTPSVTFATKTATFYGAAPTSIVASLINSVAGAGSTTAIAAVAKDAAGVTYGGALYVYSGTVATASNAGTSCSYNATNQRHECAITGVASGTTAITIRDAATVATSTVASNAVTATVSTAAPASLSMAWDKASYAPGEKATLTVTVLDSTGKPVSGRAYTNLYLTGGITFSQAVGNGSASDYTTVSPTTAAPNLADPTKAGTIPVKTYTTYMPMTGGSMVATVVGGADLPTSGQVKLTATATVTDSGAAALAAVNALATTVASLKTLITTLTNLVLKIQKKVKA
jgi:hypothetical protein